MSCAGRCISGRWLCAIALLVIGAGRATAQPVDSAERLAESERWVPSLGVYSALNLHKFEAQAASTQRGAESGDQLKAFAGLEGHLEFISPALLDGMGAPRAFVRVGAGRLWDSVHLIAENKPGRPVINLLPSGGPPPLPGVVGQGTGIRTEYSPYFYTASAGLAFAMAVAERQLRLKPSLEYRHGSVEIEGIVSHAISVAGDPNCPCVTGFLTQKEQRRHHMLGAGLELEIDTQRAGPAMISLFAGIQAYRVLSGRKLRTATAGFLDDGATPLEIRARSFLDEWSLRGGLGLRLRWFPEAVEPP